MTTPIADPPPPAAAPAPVVDTLTCRYCGSAPAIKATLRGHQGFVLVWRMLSRRGPFCRSCGIAVCRDMTADTLYQGWWGAASMILTPLVLLGNLVTRVRLGRLAEPHPGAPGTPAVPGRPVFRRAAALGLLVPVALVAVVRWSIADDPAYAAVGDCVKVTDLVTRSSVSVVDCGDPAAGYVVVGRVDDATGDAACARFSGVVASYTERQRSDRYLLCLGPNR
ncbi:LppU/SCO3897 family protein [Micromonospora auratinigra]|uniref:Uncharacterized protein n=1 Tax=Micromonospora auratinigra TaxID=261654 RepID=A0A1A9A3M6_9ACTN|nr:hypothetical protein [Micromonospora auratinigra]SBT50771.1 hypothetical protein GA0070611_4894 [Micromonospora auratinigra]